MRQTVEIIRSIVRGDQDALAATVNHTYVVLGPDGAKLRTLSWDEELRQGIAETLHERPDLAKLERLGQHLYALLGDVYEQALGAEPGTDVRIGLHLGSGEQADELFSLPFELLRSPGSGRRLAAVENVAVCYRALNARAPRPNPHPSRPIGRLLFGCFGTDLDEIRDRQIQSIQGAFSGGAAPFIQAEDIVTLSFKDVDARLRTPGARGPYSALHILCHGGPLDASEAGYGLAWSDGVHAGARIAELVAPFADTLRLVVISSCLGSAGAPGGLFDSAALALHKLGIEAVIGARTPITAEGSVLLTSALYGALVGGPMSVEAAFVQARQALRATWPGGLDHVALQLFTHDFERWDTRPFTLRPYRGLERFREQDERFFFGRDREIAETVADLEALVKSRSPRFLIVAGASGTGKSSIALAGALPELRRRGWGTAVLRPSELNSGRWRDQVAKRLDGVQGQAGVMLVVDQMEEIFTTLDAQTRQELMRDLWSRAGSASPVVAVLATLRVDFVGRCGEIVLDQDLRLDHVAYDEAHRVFIERIGPAELRRAIEEPARMVGLVLEDGLAARVAEDVESEAGALPLVQHAMDRLWLNRNSRDIAWPIGGVRGALEEHANAVYQDALSEPERASAKRILLKLVQVQGDRGSAITKLRLTRERIVGSAPEAELAGVLDRLINERLLVSEGSREAEGGDWIEIAHEALITHWKTFLEWLETARDMKAATGSIEGWAKDPERFPFLNAQQLGYAREVDAKYPGELSESARELIRRSEVETRRQASAERQRVRRLLFAAALVLAAMGLFSWEAITASIRAEQEATRSRDRNLMLAATQAGGRPLLVAALLREVAHPREVDGWMELAAGLSWTPLPEKVLGGLDARVRVAQFTPDGQHVLTLARAGVTLWPVDGLGLGERLEGALENADWAEFSTDGRGLLLRDQQGRRVQLLQLDSNEGWRKVWQREGVTSVSYAPDGSRVVLVNKEGKASVLDARPEAVEVSLNIDLPEVDQALFSGSGLRVVTFSRDGVLRLLSLEDSRVPTAVCEQYVGQRTLWRYDRSDRGDEPVIEASEEDLDDNDGPFFSPHGDLVIAHIGGDQSGWRIWNISHSNCKFDIVADNDVHAFQPMYDDVYWPTFSGDERSVMFMSKQGDPWVWTPGVGLRLVFEAPEKIWHAGETPFSSDARAILVLTTDGRLLRWPFDASESPTDLGAITPGPMGGSTFRYISELLRKAEVLVQRGGLRPWATDALSTLDTSWEGGGNVELSADGRRVLTQYEEGLTVLWPQTIGKLPVPLANLGAAMDSFASYSSNQESVVAMRGACERSWEGPKERLGAVPDRCFAIKVGRDGQLIYEVPLDGADQWRPLHGETGAYFVELSEDGPLRIAAPDHWTGFKEISLGQKRIPRSSIDHMVSVVQDQFLSLEFDELRLARISMPEQVQSLGPCPELEFAVIASDGRHAAAACSKDTVQTWEIAPDGTIRSATTIPVESEAWRGEFSKTGDWLVLYGYSHSWIVRSDGSDLRSFGRMNDVFFSPDDGYMISSPLVYSPLDSPTLWSLKGTENRHLLPVRASDVRAVEFSPDSARFRVLLNDATVREFSVEDPTEPLAIYAGPPISRGNVQELGPTFSADLEHILTTSSAGFIREWPVRDHEDVMEALWRATPYCLPPEERRVLLQENDEEAKSRFAACQARVEECQKPGAESCSTVGAR